MSQLVRQKPQLLAVRRKLRFPLRDYFAILSEIETVAKPIKSFENANRDTTTMETMKLAPPNFLSADYANFESGLKRLGSSRSRLCPYRCHCWMQYFVPNSFGAGVVENASISWSLIATLMVTNPNTISKNLPVQVRISTVSSVLPPHIHGALQKIAGRV